MAAPGEIPLTWHSPPAVRFRSRLRPSRTVYELSRPRLLTWAWLEGGAPTRCLIDTGAGWSVFPYHVWQRHESLIDWLDPVDVEAAGVVDHQGLKESLPARVGVARLQIGYKSGAEENYVRTRVFPVVGRFLEDDDDFGMILLGLGGNGLDQFRALMMRHNSQQPPAASLYGVAAGE